jgi:predicted dehydrogenase
MAKLKATIIGTGSACKIIHAPYLYSNPDVDLVAICGHVNVAALNALAKRYHVKNTYMDYQEMLAQEKPDIVNVASPSFVHREHTMAALKVGADVLCEKPMANSLEDCDVMISEAEKRSAKLMIVFHKRFNIGLEKVKEILDSRKIGKPHYAFVHKTGRWPSAHSFWKERMQGKSLPPLEEDVKRYGGGIGPALSHYIDNFRWMMGDVEFVSGEINNTIPDVRNLENFALYNLRFLNGTIATVGVGAGPTYNFEEVEKGGVFCTNGNIYFDIGDWKNPNPPEVLVQDLKKDNWTQISFKTDFINLTHYHYRRLMDYWVNCVKNDIQPSPSGKDGRATQEIVYALYQSWYTGRQVKLPLEKTPSLIEVFKKLRAECLGHFNQ